MSRQASELGIFLQKQEGALLLAELSDTCDVALFSVSV